MMKRTKIAIAAAAIVAALSFIFLAQAAAPPYGQLRVQGNKIVGANGNPAVLRGMSFFWNTPSWGGEAFYTTGTTNWLITDWKVTVVRVAIDPNQTGNANWQTVADAAIAGGIYVILDFHAHSHEFSEAAKTFFTTGMPAKYKNNPNVIYEIFNEPCPTTRNQTGGGGCKGDDWAQHVRPYSQKVVDAIRGANDNNLIIIGSGDFSKRVDLAAANPVTGTNLAYAVHYYTAEPGTQHQSSLRDYCTNALGKGLALIVTEFGVSEADGGQVNTSKIDLPEADTWFAYLDRNSIGWVNWAVNSKNEAASALRGSAGTSGSWSASDLSPSGTYIRGKLKDYAEKVHTVNVTVQGQGNVTKDPTTATYPHGSSVTLTPVAAPGWKFEGWSGANAGDISGTGIKNPGTIYGIYANKTVTAVFVEGGLINNGNFTDNVGGWNVGSGGAGNAAMAWESVSGNGAMRINVTAGGTVLNNARVLQTGIDGLTCGKEYELSFRARVVSGANKNIVARVTNSGRTIDYMDTLKASLTASWQPFTKKFEMKRPNDANVTLVFECGNSGDSWSWYLDDVLLKETGVSGQCNSSVISQTSASRRAAWSVVNANGGFTLRGPVEAGAVVSLYDTRGRLVRSMLARDGVAAGAGLSAGNYLVVVRNAAGSEVFRGRAVVVQ